MMNWIPKKTPTIMTNSIRRDEKTEDRGKIMGEKKSGG